MYINDPKVNGKMLKEYLLNTTEQWLDFQVSATEEVTYCGAVISRSKRVKLLGIFSSIPFQK